MNEGNQLIVALRLLGSLNCRSLIYTQYNFLKSFCVQNTSNNKMNTTGTIPSTVTNNVYMVFRMLRAMRMEGLQYVNKFILRLIMFLSENRHNLNTNLFFKATPRIPKFISICPYLRGGKRCLHRQKEKGRVIKNLHKFL